MAASFEGREAPGVDIPGGAPVRRIDKSSLAALGRKVKDNFTQYKSDRYVAEQRWLRAQRQYLGVYDPEVDNVIARGQSRAYPRITRTKVVSTVSRLMNLMFPGDERNWMLKASPSPDLSPQDVQEAVEAYLRGRPASDAGPPSREVIAAAIKARADADAVQLAELVDDQLQELGGDQSQDYVTLNRRVVRSGAIYGVGLLRGPFAVETTTRSWIYADPAPEPAQEPDMYGVVAPAVVSSPYKLQSSTRYKPVFEFLSVWDFYPDMSAKTLREMSGYFVRSVMTRSQLLALAKREDFFGDVIRDYVRANPTGDYLATAFETELKTMGVRVSARTQKAQGERYEVFTWHGQTTGSMLAECGVDVPEKRLVDEVASEIWVIGDKVIKADMNPWDRLGVDVPSLHAFIFDEDDTSPLGQGLCDIIRDTQMGACNVARMMLDNASVVCGPMVEVNEQLLAPGQDTTTLEAYKIFRRDGDEDPMLAQYPAVREIKVESHIAELQSVLRMFYEWADSETFVSPQTGGDNSLPSEPMRTIGGASMLRGDAALPFKDIVRNYDTLTASVIGALVAFNRQFNPDAAPKGDYDVIPRGATSLIAKELRAIQIMQTTAQLSPDEKLRIDLTKLTRAKFAALDLNDMVLPDDQIAQTIARQEQQMQQQTQQQQQMFEAQLRTMLADAFKSIQQGVKNAANADAQQASSALDILRQAGMMGGYGEVRGVVDGGMVDGGMVDVGQGDGVEGVAAGGGQVGAGGADAGGSADPGLRPSPALDAILGGA